MGVLILSGGQEMGGRRAVSLDTRFFTSILRFLAPLRRLSVSHHISLLSVIGSVISCLEVFYMIERERAVSVRHCLLARTIPRILYVVLASETRPPRSLSHSSPALFTHSTCNCTLNSTVPAISSQVQTRPLSLKVCLLPTSLAASSSFSSLLTSLTKHLLTQPQQDLHTPTAARD